MLFRLFSKLIGRDDREAGPRDDREAAPEFRLVINAIDVDAETVAAHMRWATRTYERAGLGTFL